MVACRAIPKPKPLTHSSAGGGLRRHLTSRLAVASVYDGLVSAPPLPSPSPSSLAFEPTGLPQPDHTTLIYPDPSRTEQDKNVLGIDSDEYATIEYREFQQDSEEFTEPNSTAKIYATAPALRCEVRELPALERTRSRSAAPGMSPSQTKI